MKTAIRLNWSNLMEFILLWYPDRRAGTDRSFDLEVEMSKLMDEVSLLRSIPIFANVLPNKLKLLAFASERMTFTDGQSIVRQGDRSDAAYIIITGVADVLVSTGEENTAIVGTLGRNAMVGDMGILAGIQRTATVRANGEVEALMIRKEHLIELVRDSPDLALDIVKSLVDRLVKTTMDLAKAKEQLKRYGG